MYWIPYQENNTSHSLMGIVGIIKYKLHWNIKRKLLLRSPGEHLHIEFSPLAYAMLLQPFKEQSLDFFSDLTHDCTEIYMDDFIVYRNTFEEALENLEKSL